MFHLARRWLQQSRVLTVRARMRASFSVLTLHTQPLQRRHRSWWCGTAPYLPSRWTTSGALRVSSRVWGVARVVTMMRVSKIVGFKIQSMAAAAAASPSSDEQWLEFTVGTIDPPDHWRQEIGQKERLGSDTKRNASMLCCLWRCFSPQQKG